MKTKKTLISSETHEALSIRLNYRGQPRPEPVRCDECATEALLISVEMAAPLARLSVRVICQLVEDELIHFRETSDGLLLVCLNSINECPSTHYENFS